MNSLNRQLTMYLLRFCTALRFLTIVPVSWRAEEDGEHFKSCLPFFPLIGMLIGCCGVCAVFLLQCIFPPSVVAAFTIVYLAFISGCLHLDGLSDSADGLFSARPRERALEIMKDSRVGSMGVVAVVFVLLAKFAALASLSGATLYLTVFFMPIIGRCSIIFTMALKKYAREEGGIGALFYSESSRKTAFISAVGLLLLLLAIAPAHLIVLACGVSLMIYLFGAFCSAKIGGATGDTLGAVCELTEMATAVLFTVSFTHF